MQTTQLAQNSSPQISKRNEYLLAGQLGAFRGFCGLPIEHPFDVLKTRLQANASVSKIYKNNPDFAQITNNSMLKNWGQIYKQYGLFNGIYAGYVPSLIRVMSKQFYRFPMMIYFPLQFQKIIPEPMLKKYDGIHKIATAFTIACLESFIICPFESLKVYLMTKQKNTTKSIRQFCQQQSSSVMPKKSLFKFFYQGMDALLYRQIISWVSFLYLDYKVKKEYKAFKGMELKQPLGNDELLVLSCLIGVGNVLVVQPFDKIKTVLQMQNNEIYSNNTFLRNMSIICKTEGIKGVYSGIRPRMVHYVINSIFTCTILEKLETNLLNNSH